MLHITDIVPPAKMNGERPGKARRSVLSLDKSELPFEQLLDDVSIMLGVNLSSLSQNCEALHFSTSPFNLEDGINGPRYEWTLKWILNKLCLDIGHGSPCLEVRAWDLLRYLMRKIRPAKVAQTLTGKKFLVAVRRTLGWLRRRVRKCQVYSSDDDSESSSDGKTKSKKRKRVSTESSAQKPRLICYQDVGPLTLAVCETLHQAQVLMKYQSVANTTVEQLKIALRCDLEEAANIVGDALYMLDTIYRYLIGCDGPGGVRISEGNGWQSETLVSYTQALTEFWSLQLSGRGDLNHAGFVSSWQMLYLLSNCITAIVYEILSAARTSPPAHSTTRHDETSYNGDFSQSFSRFPYRKWYRTLTEII